MNNNVISLEEEFRMKEFIGQKIVDADDGWWLYFEDGSKAHIDFIVYK